MAYLGDQPSNNFVSLKRQVITGNGGSTYTLDHKVASVNDVAIFVNNVRQNPSTYSISTTTLTLGGSISSSDSCYVIFLGQALQTVTPGTDTITNAMLKSDATNLTLLHSTDVSSSVSSVDIDGFFSSTYDKYFIAISNLTISTDTKYLIIKVNVGGSSQTSTIYTQLVGGNRILTDGTAQAMDAGVYSSFNYIFANWHQSLNVGADSDGYNAELWLNDPLQTTKHKQIYINSVYYGHGSPERFVTERNANLVRTTSALSGINFSCTGSATIDKGTISLYGLRK